MTTAEYRDEISHLSDLIASAKGCTEAERPFELDRVANQWSFLARARAPKRCPKKVAERRDRVMGQAAELLNRLTDCPPFFEVSR